MIEPTQPSSTERHNAMISYCFLSSFMLLSREERFNNAFVRSHARYAFLLHVGFLVLIITLIRSSNFASIIIFGASWVHILLFIGFIVLLGFLGAGIYRALMGKSPKITLQSISLASLKNLGEKTELQESQKIPLILSHIPFFGTYLVQKYGSFLSPGEKFGNWAFIIIAWALWVDPSMTLFIMTLSLTTFWIVYQSVIVTSGDNVRLLGTKFPGASQCHIILRSSLSYMRLLLNHDNMIPLWKDILTSQKKKFEENHTISPSKLAIPIINISSIIRSHEKLTTPVMDAILINILLVYSLWFFHIPLLMLLLLGTWWMYWQTNNNKSTSLPVITEISMVLIKIIEWKKKKSTPQVQINPL